MTRTVVLADDHALFRQGVRALIEDAAQVVGEAASGEEAVRLVEAERPDVLLLDVEMPGGGAEQTIARVRRLAPETAVVVLTMHTDAVLQRRLLGAGASAFAHKGIDETSLRDLIAGVGLTTPGEEAAPAPVDGILTDRELEVIGMIARAYTNREISARLSIAEGTVKRHTTNIYAKLGATSRIDAVRKALRLNLLSGGDIV